MTDKEILQGIDKLEDGIPFDEIRNGDKWLDIHELFSEIRERINPWHYPSKGEYPPKGRQILAYAWNVHNVLAKYDTFDGKDRFVTFDAYNGFIEIKKVIRWQYIEPPKEEA